MPGTRYEMNRLYLLMLILAALLLPGPALAHGDEKHGPAAAPTSNVVQPDVSPGHGVEAGVTHETARAASEHEGGHENAGGIVGALGNLHPATVHFPIALFLMAALTELFVMSRRTPDREAAVRIMLYGGAAGALIAVLFGWIHTGFWWGGDAVMQAHRWNGMLLAILGGLAAWIARRQRRTRGLLRALIFFVVILIIVQGFLGGELAHGPDHLGI